MKRIALETIVGLALSVAILVIFGVIFAHGQQTRVYDPNGQSVGTIAPQGEGSQRYYDSRGRSLGTSTITGNTTRFYNSRGQPIGSATKEGVRK
jgi:YD repeat-containing protein